MSPTKTYWSLPKLPDKDCMIFQSSTSLMVSRQDDIASRIYYMEDIKWCHWSLYYLMFYDFLIPNEKCIATVRRTYILSVFNALALVYYILCIEIKKHFWNQHVMIANNWSMMCTGCWWKMYLLIENCRNSCELAWYILI